MPITTTIGGSNKEYRCEFVCCDCIKPHYVYMWFFISVLLGIGVSLVSFQNELLGHNPSYIRSEFPLPYTLIGPPQYINPAKEYTRTDCAVRVKSIQKSLRDVVMCNPNPVITSLIDASWQSCDANRVVQVASAKPVSCYQIRLVDGVQQRYNCTIKTDDVFELWVTVKSSYDDTTYTASTLVAIDFPLKSDTPNVFNHRCDYLVNDELAMTELYLNRYTSQEIWDRFVLASFWRSILFLWGSAIIFVLQCLWRLQSPESIVCCTCQRVNKDD